MRVRAGKPPPSVLYPVKNGPSPAGPSPWKDWLQVSTVHGVLDSTLVGYGRPWRVTWALVMLTFAGFTAYSVREVIQEYLANPTVQSYKEEPQSMFVLPDTIICTHQRFNTVELSGMGASEELVSAITIVQDSGNIAFAMTGDEEVDQKEIKEEYDRFRLDRNVTFEDIMQIASIKCEDIIKACSWGQPCCRSASSFLDMNYGQCYRFETGQTDRGHAYQTYPGSGSGIQMILRSNFSRLGQSKRDAIKGLLMDIVHPDEPQSFNYFQIPAGVSATILLSHQVTERINLFGRTRTCSEIQAKPPDGGRFTLDYLRKSANGCYYAVWSTLMAKYCNCTPMPFLAEIPHCDPSERCSLPPHFMNETTELQAACLPQCTRRTYSVTVTYSIFDGSVFDRMNGSKELAEPDVILADIYHPRMEYVHVTEIDVYTLITLISNIGGAAGLWLGASLMSVIQPIFYFCKWMSVKCRRRMIDPCDE